LDRSIKDCKGNDKVFKAFAKFVSIYRKRAKLIVVEKGWDVEASKRLVRDLGIEKFVEWIKSVPKREIYQYYNIADVVLDQFVVGVLTLVSVEAMSCGTPVLSYVEKAPEEMFYAKMPPIVNINTVDSIYASMLSLADNEDFRKAIGNQGREWVEQNCQPDVAIPYYINLIDEVINKKK
jgi:glycosyltransferase involved in cell wall biosynthesis